MRKYLSTLLVASMLIASCSKDAEVIREKIISQSRPILSGQGQPENGKGEDGDYYLDLKTANLYGPKTKEGWGQPALNLKGLNGQAPRIGDNGNWWIDGQDTGRPARGNDGQQGPPGSNGQAPRIGDNGNWWIDGQDTGRPARGNDGQPGAPGAPGAPGQPGANGQTPTITISEDGYWKINGQLTTTKARGENGTNGQTPTISINEDGYWKINGQVTTTKARGENGANGQTPTISINEDGYWMINGRATTTKARGENGVNGQTPTITISEDGYWMINGVTSTTKARGNDGQDGANGSKILAEDRAPQATDGVKGDYFIDKAAKIFYGPKTASGWPTTGISLVPGNTIATADYQLSPDGKTLVKWLNKKTRYIDMNADPKLSEVEKIANNAFDDREADYDLSTIIVGDKVTELGIFTFSKCTRLRRIELPDGLITIGKGAFDACFNLQYINIPETVTNLGEQAFTNCTKLKTITIPKGISSFGKRTFAGCTALRTLTLENPVGFEINKAGMQAAFQGVTLNVIYVPYGSADSYKSKNKSSYSNYENIIKSIVIQ